VKRAYGSQIESLVCSHINHITKLEFLPAFKAAFAQSFTESNIRASFRGAGLVPHNPEAVLSKLDVRLPTLSPAAVLEVLWESRTPSNARELESQSTLIRERLQGHQDSSPTSVLQSLDRLTRGAETMAHELVLLRDQVFTLQKADEAATKRRERKKKRLQKQGP
jgi:hypothetical protein